MPLDLIAPVAGLPVGPATEPVVRALVTVYDNADDVLLTAAINAVNVHVQGLRSVDEFVRGLADPIPIATVWPLNLAYGCSLLASRLFSRRNSPEGVSAFTSSADGGAVYIQRNDPDIAMMLGIGAHAKPAVG